MFKDRSSFFAWFGGVLVIIFIFFHSINHLDYTKRINGFKGEQDELSSTISKILENRLTSLKALAENPLLVEEVQKDALTSESILVKSVLDSAKRMTNSSIVYLMNLNGDVVSCSTYGKGKTLFGKNYSFRPYFKGALTGKTIVYPALGVTTGKRGIYLGTPVRKDGKIVGVLVFKVSPKSIDKILNTKKTPYLFVSPDGVVFVSNHKEWMFKLTKKIDKKKLDALRKSKQFGNEKLSQLAFDLTREKIKLNNSNFLIIRTPSKIKGWTIIGLHDLNFSGLILSKRTIAIVTILALGIFIMWTIIIFLFESIKYRKKMGKELRSIILSISSGDLTQKLEADPDDETYELALGLNTFTENIKNKLLNVSEGLAKLHELKEELSNRSKVLDNSVESQLKTISYVGIL